MEDVENSECWSITHKENGQPVMLCRYVVFNPVRAQVVDQPDPWVWSNDGATAGLETCPPFLDVAWTWEHFGVRPATAPRRDQTFVPEGLGRPGPWEYLRGQLFLGDDKFVAKHQPGWALKESSRQHTQAVRPRLTALLPRKHTLEQALAEAYRTHEYQMRAIGDHLASIIPR